MIEKLVPFCLIIFSPYVGLSQIPVLTLTNNYLARDTLRHDLMPPTDTFFITGAGPGQTWVLADDFTVGGDAEYYTNCSANIYCDSFPGTTVSAQGIWNTSSVFYNETPSVLSVSGVYDTTAMVYLNYMDILRYPFTYNSTYLDSFAAKYTSGGETFFRYGTINVTGDACGTLVNLYYDTFSNTLRVHTIKNYVDSNVGSATINHFVEDSYDWYVPGYRGSLATQESKMENGTRISHKSYFTNERKRTTLLPTNLVSLGTEIYPNPATSELTIRTKEKINTISISNLLGREVYYQAFNSPQVQINISNLPSGI